MTPGSRPISCNFATKQSSIKTIPLAPNECKLARIAIARIACMAYISLIEKNASQSNHRGEKQNEKNR